MRSILSAGAVALGLVIASPSYALDLSGSYLASFSVANGSQTPVCFVLTSTGAQKTYSDMGTVASPTYPNYSGAYVVYKGGFHLTFVMADKPSVTITGKIAGGKLATTSATKFLPSGAIQNVGTLAATGGCSAD